VTNVVINISIISNNEEVKVKIEVVVIIRQAITTVIITEAKIIYNPF
jgi:hypothetical protein